MITAGIVGASGYSGEVLLELLSGHPEVRRIEVASRSHAGKAVEEVLPRLAGRLPGTQFIAADPGSLAAVEVDVWFLALPHGVAAEYAMPLTEAGRLVIDLSADFRLRDPELYRRYYGADHPVPGILSRVPYVLPEWDGETAWKDASLIACPGCYPTSVLLPLLPLLKEGVIGSEGIVINSLSGVTGAGKKESLFYSYAERAESALAYGLGKHRHLAEMEEQAGIAVGGAVKVQFTPHLVPMMRGIATTMVIPSEASGDDVYRCWENHYGGRPGIRLLPAGKTPETRSVTGRNRVDISALADGRTGNLLITSAIDNLMKGASGQAVQIMNLRLGFPEQAGLR